jgi:hypothetical protein
VIESKTNDDGLQHEAEILSTANSLVWGAVALDAYTLEAAPAESPQIQNLIKRPIY